MSIYLGYTKVCGPSAASNGSTSITIDGIPADFSICNDIKMLMNEFKDSIANLHMCNEVGGSQMTFTVMPDYQNDKDMLSYDELFCSDEISSEQFTPSTIGKIRFMLENDGVHADDSHMYDGVLVCLSGFINETIVCEMTNAIANNFSNNAVIKYDFTHDFILGPNDVASFKLAIIKPDESVTSDVDQLSSMSVKAMGIFIPIKSL